MLTGENFTTWAIKVEADLNAVGLKFADVSGDFCVFLEFELENRGKQRMLSPQPPTSLRTKAPPLLSPRTKASVPPLAHHRERTGGSNTSSDRDTHSDRHGDTFDLMH